jgi:hypothetical protein
MDVKVHTCPECANESKVVFLTAPKIDWGKMGAQANASPEFIDRFEKTHKQQADKEAKFEKEHGEGEYYNVAPGG